MPPHQKQPDNPAVGPRLEEPSVPADLAGGDAEPTNKPKGLRLSSILLELGAEAEPQPPAPAEPPDPVQQKGATAWERRQKRRLNLRRKPRVRSNITLGEIIDRTAHAGFGFLGAFLALVSLPFVGLGLPFGMAIAFIGLQMITGREKPWLPARLRRHVVTMKTLDWISHHLARWTSWLERFIRPQWTFLTRGPFWTAVGVGLVIQGFGLALPLPLPGSNWLFIFPVLLYSIGLLEDDGRLVTLGHVATGIQLVLGLLFWRVVQNSVVRVVEWISGLL